jgi:hypothetical protein
MEWDEDDMEKDLIPQIRSAKDLTLDQAHALIEVDTGDFDAVDTPSVIAQVRAALAS